MRIAFVGKAGAGKTALALYLGSAYDFHRLCFAGKVKEFAVAILMRGIKKGHPAYRGFLQALGDGARKIDPNIWIRWFDMEQLGEFDDAPECNLVVDDCRYLNEVEYLREHGFIFIRVTGRQSKLPAVQAAHVSETELESFADAEFVLDNSGTFEQTVSRLNTFLSTLTQKRQDRQTYMAMRLNNERGAR